MRVAFCGHGNYRYNKEIEIALYNILERLINQGCCEFLIGGYGDFDCLVAKVVKKLKNKYPEIKSALVTPYINREMDKDLYDYSIYPPLENVPLRYAISKRNEWMVRNSDVVVAYVEFSWGGANKMLEFATKNKKKVINIYEILAF